MPFIGIDLGTSFLKGAVLDADACQIRHIHRLPFPAPIAGLPPGQHEYDPAPILAAVRELIAVLLPLAAPCEGLLLCNQMHGLILSTAAGEPRSNLTTWQDQREGAAHPSGGGTYFDHMMARLSTDEKRSLGNELRIGLPIGVLFWLAEQDRLPDGLYPLSLPDYLLVNLCGASPSTEATNAHAHGLLNLETGGWHKTVIEKLGLNRLCWPEIRPHGEVVGWLEHGSERIPCYASVGDFQCAITGALLWPGELSVNISTGSQVSLIRPAASFGRYQTRPYFDGRWLATVTTIPAGRSLNALVRLLSELAEAQGLPLADPWPYIAEAAEAVAQRADSSTAIQLRADLSFFNSAIGTHGALTDIREEELTVGHLFYAAFRSMAANYRTCALRLSPDEGWDQLVFSGGVAQKVRLLRDLISAEFGREYRLSPSAEDTMLGLMALAMAYTGRARFVADAQAILSKCYREPVQ